MLHGITTSKQAGKSETPAELLVGCHDRIRHFTSVVRKLAHAEGVADTEISAAAESAYRYFTISLPLHEADEEQSLRPRLLESGSGEVCAAVEAMTHQHQAIDDLLERMMPLLVMLANHPAKLPEAHAELCGLSKSLEEVFAGHLELEEKVLFPAIPAGSQNEMLREMKDRRRQGQ
ncbi:MAG TPA: hemerythrin domain-containing protein [Candidatus Koribacter sp.]|jgi:iron-sulfur cluster repair protein YtfE (RIC family)